MKFQETFPNNVLGIFNIGMFPECTMNILRMLNAFFLGGLRKTTVVSLVDKTVPDIHCVSLKI